jgi:hypothetical protein
MPVSIFGIADDIGGTRQGENAVPLGFSPTIGNGAEAELPRGCAADCCIIATLSTSFVSKTIGRETFVYRASFRSVPTFSGGSFGGNLPQATSRPPYLTGLKRVNACPPAHHIAVPGSPKKSYDFAEARSERDFCCLGCPKTSRLIL